MTKFEEEFNYLIELSGKVLIGQVDAEKFEENRVAFFEKYNKGQQQTLPVVPECVAEWIEFCKNSKNIFSFLNQDSFYHSGKAKELCEKVRRWSQMSEEKLTLMARAWLDGYTVEKPQLFYLKNKLTGLNLVLEQCFNIAGNHVGEQFREYNMQYVADEQEARRYKNTFTQAEIDSMQTGSYEKIEVAE